MFSIVLNLAIWNDLRGVCVYKRSLLYVNESSKWSIFFSTNIVTRHPKIWIWGTCLLWVGTLQFGNVPAIITMCVKKNNKIKQKLAYWKTSLWFGIYAYKRLNLLHYRRFEFKSCSKKRLFSLTFFFITELRKLHTQTKRYKGRFPRKAMTDKDFFKKPKYFHFVHSVVSLRIVITSIQKMQEKSKKKQNIFIEGRRSDKMLLYLSQRTPTISDLKSKT